MTLPPFGSSTQGIYQNITNVVQSLRYVASAWISLPDTETSRAAVATGRAVVGITLFGVPGDKLGENQGTVTRRGSSSSGEDGLAMGRWYVLMATAEAGSNPGLAIRSLSSGPLTFIVDQVTVQAAA